jgi:predicted Zn finger-like uncharacterized protein
MALATKCPHCNTIFRVAADQLKLRGGIVRCGSCKEVFDGNAALVDPAALAASPVPPYPVVPSPMPVMSPDWQAHWRADWQADPHEDDAAPDTELDHAPETPRAPAGTSPLDERLSSLDERAAQLPPAAAAPADYILDFDTAVDTVDLPAQAEPAAAAGAAHLDFELDLDPVDTPAAEAPGATAAEPAASPPDADGRREPVFHFEPFELPDPLPDPAEDEAHESLVGTALRDDAPHEALFDDAPAVATAPIAPPAADNHADDDRAAAAAAASRGPAWVVRTRSVDAASDDSPHAAAVAPSRTGPAEASARKRANKPKRSPAPTDTLTTTPASAPPDNIADDPDEPGFVRQGRRRERTGKKVQAALAAGSLLLVMLLLVQGMTTFRNQLAAFVPALKPTLVSMCSAFGCRVALPAQIDALAIEQGELQTLAENTFSYASVLRNQSAAAQAWPSIELTLNDTVDKPVLRRVFGPHDYLPAGVDTARGFTAHSEQSVKLYFELAQVKASGYHIAVFYP